jgi:hypothetical protein
MFMTIVSLDRRALSRPSRRYSFATLELNVTFNPWSVARD